MADTKPWLNHFLQHALSNLYTELATVCMSRYLLLIFQELSSTDVKLYLLEMADQLLCRLIHSHLGLLHPQPNECAMVDPANLLELLPVHHPHHFYRALPIWHPEVPLQQARPAQKVLFQRALLDSLRRTRPRKKRLLDPAFFLLLQALTPRSCNPLLQPTLPMVVYGHDILIDRHHHLTRLESAIQI